MFLLMVFTFNLINTNAIIVTGNKTYSKDVIQNIVGINKKTNLFVYKLASKKYDLEEYPYIENIDIKYNSINNVEIIVTEKNIISYIPYMGRYLCLGSEGDVIDYTDKIQKDIPIVHGLSFDHFIIGDKLFDQNSIIFRSIVQISYKINKFDLKIDYIDFNFNDPKQIVLKIDKISVLIGDINDINRKFELLKGVIEKLPVGSDGMIDLHNLSKKNIVFTPSDSK
ncbi:MAG: FtsQ-type POTRA domain-containing protein [Vallitalea sp.]|jgi:cell division protein FtsQ|nr:FtsQ-type POTRA domain-containing protein [Vallitalea sp.]